jgi:hypothetical protein
MRSSTELTELIKQKQELIKDIEKQISWTLDMINNGVKLTANADQFKKLFFEIELQNGLLNRLYFDLKVTKTYELLTQEQSGSEPESTLRELEKLKTEKNFPEVLQIRIDQEIKRLEDQINWKKFERRETSMRNLSDYMQENENKEFSIVGGIFPYSDKSLNSETILEFLDRNPDFDKPFITSEKDIEKIDIALGYYLKSGREIKFKTVFGDYTTELIELPPPENKIEEYIELLKEKQIKEILRLMVQLDDEDQDQVIDLIEQKFERNKRK